MLQTETSKLWIRPDHHCVAPAERCMPRFRSTQTYILLLLLFFKVWRALLSTYVLDSVDKLIVYFGFSSTALFSDRNVERVVSTSQAYFGLISSWTNGLESHVKYSFRLQYCRERSRVISMNRYTYAVPTFIYSGSRITLEIFSCVIFS